MFGDRQNKHIAEDEGDADYEGGRRDHREGVRECPNSPIPVEDRTPKLAMHWAVDKLAAPLCSFAGS